jgi:hypothetical protein
MTSENPNLNAARMRAGELENIIAYLHEKYSDYPEYVQELSTPYVERLQGERSRIDEAVGIPVLPGADTILHIRTRESTEEGPRASLLVDSISNFRTALTKVTMRLRGQSRMGSGRLPEDLRKVTDFRVVGFAPGSVKIGVRFERVTTQTVLTDEEPATPLEVEVQKALELLRKAAATLGEEGDDDALRTLIPDRELRGTVLRELSRMSPTVRGKITSISLEGGPASRIQSVLLTPNTGKRALGILFPDSEIEPFDDIGTLRAVDVDRDLPKHLFVLRNRPENKPDVEGDFDEALRFAVMDAVDKAHLVRVRGMLERPRGRPGKDIVHIESVDLA